jgi:3-deoxy-manno-octulosonate cytidylyltransferase (CMP-KDO synthetase)
MVQSGASVWAVIPARLASTRFPAKALARIAGEPMIVHVVRRASSASSVEHVVVATDDDGIATAAAGAGAEVVMTGECASGTDRVAAAVLGRDEWAIVVNVQGDEPLLPGENIDVLVEGLQAVSGAPMATLCRPLTREQVSSPDSVKVVRDSRFRALYFSRSVIPYARNAEAAGELWRLHLGIYAFRREGLARFVGLPPSPLECAEGLEQLRALENGLEMLVLDAPRDSWGVDTPEDLVRAEVALEAMRG